MRRLGTLGGSLWGRFETIGESRGLRGARREKRSYHLMIPGDDNLISVVISFLFKWFSQERLNQYIWTFGIAGLGFVEIVLAL